MPYISPKRVKEIRKSIKAEFPKFNFSIRTRHYSVVDVSILSGPVELITPTDYKRHVQVNTFYIKDHYEKYPEIRDILQKIYEIMNEGNCIESEDGDYGSIPAFYCHLSIGQWDKDYQVIA